MKRIISMCLSAVLLLSLCVTGAAKTKTAQAECNGADWTGLKSEKGKGDRRSEWLCDTSAGI